MNELVHINRNKEAVTTSRKLAEHFQKRHDNLLQKISQLKLDDKEIFTALNIKVSHYVDDSGKKNKEFNLNRDAYAFFAMGFTGKKANKFKIDFIHAFNDMEKWITERVQASVEYKVMSTTLKETRLIDGKETQRFHYANEAKLVNWAITGEFKPLDRATLSLKEIDLLNLLQTKNTVLIAIGMSRDLRKEALKTIVELNRNVQLID